MITYFSCTEDEEGLKPIKFNGDYYYYAVEYGTNSGGTEDLVIFDSCDREVPIDMASIPKLVKALNMYHDMYMQMRQGELLKEELEAWGNECVVE